MLLFTFILYLYSTGWKVFKLQAEFIPFIFQFCNKKQFYNFKPLSKLMVMEMLFNFKNQKLVIDTKITFHFMDIKLKLYTKPGYYKDIK